MTKDKQTRPYGQRISSRFYGGDLALRNSCRAYRQLRGMIQPVTAGRESSDDLTDNIADYLYLASHGFEPLTGKPSIEKQSFEFPPIGFNYRKDLPEIMQGLGLISKLISERNKNWHGYESYPLTIVGEDIMKELIAEGYYEKTRKGR